MRLHVDDSVRLTIDLPERFLHKGDVGRVCSTWFAPDVAYEVEFRSPEDDVRSRVLVRETQVEIDSAEHDPERVVEPLKK
jgi:hypothetical protein